MLNFLNFHLIKNLYKNANFANKKNFQKQHFVELNIQSNILKKTQNKECSKNTFHFFRKSTNSFIFANNSTNLQICHSIPSDKNFESSNDLENLNFQKNSKRGMSNFNMSEYSMENAKYRKNLFPSLNKAKKSSIPKQNSRFIENSKQQVVSITYEEIGLFPRSLNRVFDRFFKQLFFDVENLVIQEYRFYRYLFLTTVKCLFILIFVPFGINFLAKNYLIRPITEYYWNTHNHEIFLNSYQQKRAFSEFQNFEEKIYFESLLLSENQLFEKSDISNLQRNQINSKIVLDDGKAVSTSKHFVPQISNTNLNSVQSSKIHSYENSEFIQNVKNTNFPHSTYSDTTMTYSPQEFSLNSRAYLINQSKLQNFTTFSDFNFSNSLQPFDKNALFFNSQTQYGIQQSNISNTAFSLEKNDLSSVDFSTLFRNSLQKRFQKKILELAKHYNEESIEAVTNFFADVLSFGSLCFLLFRLEIQINITKSFLLEVFFGLDDSKKSLLILFVTDLLVGYHSPNIWELFFQTLFDHYGLPESQTTIFLLVATLPVLLDVLFKYLIFRHLNRASPATVATYHAMIE